MIRHCAVLSVVVLIGLASAGWSAPQEAATAPQGNRLITISGVLTDASGQPRTGSLGLTFSLYAAQAGGDPVWQEWQVAQTDVAGRYTVLLGAATPGGVPPEVFGDGKAQWLGVQVDGDAEQPRVLLVAVPYALRAVDADTLGGKPIASFVLSSDLAQAVEKEIASPTTGTTSGSGTKVTTSGAVAPLGYEGGDSTWYGQYAGNAGGGSYNAFFGQYAGWATTGTDNAFFGRAAGWSNTTASFNTFVGFQAGGSNTTGPHNAFFGAEAGESNTTGSHNAFFGDNAGTNNTTGSGNAFLGDGVGWSNWTENNNTFVGTYSNGAPSITNATAIGYQAQVTQSNSLVLGSINGTNGATADTNVGIGTTAPTARLHVVGDVKVGDNLSGANNVVMGAGTALPTWSGNVELNNESGVGFHFRALTAKFDIGPGSGGAPTYPGLLSLSMDGKVGIGTTSPAYPLHVVGDVYTTGHFLTASDRRLKEDVQDLGYGLREVLRLRPVSYRWKDPSLGQPTFGLIAQEVQPVLPELVSRGQDAAGLLSLNYTGLIPVLVKAMQEQQAQKDAEIAALNARLAALEEQLARLLKQQEPPQPR